MPKIVVQLLVIAALTSLVPLAVIYRAKFSTSKEPRVHLVWHMDNQTRYKAQQENDFFDDKRAMRSQEEGTIARPNSGEPSIGDPAYPGYMLGMIDPSKPFDGVDASNFVSEIPERVFPDFVAKFGGDPFSGEIENEDEESRKRREESRMKFLASARRASVQSVVQRGRDRFNIHCALCHGASGDGQGRIHKRAMELIALVPDAGGMAPTWTPPSDMTSEIISAQPVGQLFNTITHGVRTMPSYGAQIPVQDRWAIVSYIRALQRAANATFSDFTPEELEKLFKQRKKERPDDVKTLEGKKAEELNEFDNAYLEWAKR